jgi:hypothetical protein
MNEELKEACEDLSAFFNFSEDSDVYTEVFSEGESYYGVVDDELTRILSTIKSIISED